MSKLKEVNREKLNENDINPDSYISIEIGKITFSNPEDVDIIYCKVKLDENDEKRTEVKNIKDANFSEKLIFSIEEKPLTLSIEIYSSNTNQFIGATSINIYNIKTENEQIIQESTIKDDNDTEIGSLKPKITIVTSNQDMYQKLNTQYKRLEENIKLNQKKINQLNEELNEFILPYKTEFEKIKILRGSNIMINNGELLFDKKITALKGHKNTINTIKYFINRKNKNEYLISTDKNKIVIVWDITNNYNNLYNINTNYGDNIYSCLLIFSNYDNYNFIVTSTKNISNDADKSSTKIYSLDDGKLIKYINNSNNYNIFYLLSWENKNNKKYYIIEFANNKIVINNLLED